MVACAGGAMGAMVACAGGAMGAMVACVGGAMVACADTGVRPVPNADCNAAILAM
jgi:hypothetical protein